MNAEQRGRARRLADYFEKPLVYVAEGPARLMRMTAETSSILRELLAQDGEAVAALRELVALKDLKDRINAADLCTYSVSDVEDTQAMDDDYEHRKPLAWAAARAAIAKEQK